MVTFNKAFQQKCVTPSKAVINKNNKRQSALATAICSSHLQLKFNQTLPQQISASRERNLSMHHCDLQLSEKDSFSVSMDT